MKRHFFISIVYMEVKWGFIVKDNIANFIHSRKGPLPTMPELKVLAKEMFPKAKKIVVIGISEIADQDYPEFSKTFNS